MQEATLPAAQQEPSDADKQVLETELSEVFYVESQRKRNVQIHVRLCSEGVYLRRDSGRTSEQLIRMEDIIGSSCGPRKQSRTRTNCRSTKQFDEEHEASAGADSSAYLYIYAYQKKDKPLQRVKTLRILRFQSSNDYAANLRMATLWNDAIRRYKTHSGHNGFVRAISKQLLILLNPKSGSGKGREMFQKHVVPLLREANTQYELQITTHSNFAQEFVRVREDLLERYAGIVVASGDGLFYEVLNGLMERTDWRRACQELPLGIIPCGSGNGLAKSIAHHCDEPYEPNPILHATLTCISGRTTPMDVVRVELASANKHCTLYSFLSIGWGLIADIDIESERLRSIGAQRFLIWAVRRLITLRTYKGRLSYLPVQAQTKATTAACTEAVAAVPTELKINRNAEFMDALSITDSTECQDTLSYLPVKERASTDVFTDADDDLSAEQRLNNDPEFMDALSITYSSRRHDSWHSATSRYTTYYSVGGQSLRSSRSASIAQRMNVTNPEPTEQAFVSTLPKLDVPLQTGDWVCEEGDFVMVHAAYTTHLASDCFFAPDSLLNDGLIHLVVIRAGISRAHLLNFMLRMSTGTHIPEITDPYIRVETVRAFRIEPSDNQGILTIDGERVAYGSIQAEIMPSMINVMTMR